MRKEPFVVTAVLSVIFFWVYSGSWPVYHLHEWRAGLKAAAGGELDFRNYQEIRKDGASPETIKIDFTRGVHFWNPQIAVWLEDSAGNYLETLYVTHSTARGIFYGGRTSENFRIFDEKGVSPGAPLRRVNALPVWSHKRGVKYADGLYSPSPEQPLPDGISGATPTANFVLYLHPAEKLPSTFKVRLELNVAFDENEYYSEYDFPEDTVYHGGTGQLGQPSVVYEAHINGASGSGYYLMQLAGHGHHSGQTGELLTDLSGLTTALEVAERILVSVAVESL